jgi:hypothetical protein
MSRLFDRGKVGWNVLQWTLIVLIAFASTLAMLLNGLSHNLLPFVGMVLGLGVYVWRYAKLRERGWLGDPLPLLPWRIAVVFLILTVISFVIGWGVSGRV